MKRLFLISLITLTQSACATAVRGVNEPFKISTIPEGAVVTTTLIKTSDETNVETADPGEPSYLGCAPTPCEFTVPRRSKFAVRVEKNGFHPVQFAVKSKASLAGTATSASVPTSVTISGSVAAASAAPGFLGLNAYFTAVNASGTALLSTPVVAIDAATGSMLSVYPNPVEVTLTPVSENEPINYDLDNLSDGNDTIDYGYTAQQKKAQRDAEPEHKNK